MQYDYDGPFLELWSAARRSLIVNQFCFAVRGGARDVGAVLEAIERDAEKRIASGYEPQEESQKILLMALDTDEARKFAEHILWRESLPYEERHRLKEQAAQGYRQNWMEQKPPTPKQLKYLEALACHVIPSSMAEASQLIDKYKHGGAA
jgi:hypothetical protein